MGDNHEDWARGRARVVPALGFATLVAGAAMAGGVALGVHVHEVAGDPNPAYEPPTVTSTGGTTRIVNHGARRHVQVGNVADAAGQLLFLEARAAAPLDGGRSAWPDRAGGRLVLFDEKLRVTGAAQGSPDGRRVLTQPLAAVGLSGNVIAVEGDGAALHFRDGVPIRWVRPALVRGVIGAASRGHLIAARTIAEVELAPVQAGEPLLWVLDSEGRIMRTLDKVDVPANAFLGQLVNAGSIATDSRGNIYFAFALRPEVRRYRPGGRLSWVSTRPLTSVPESPTLAAPNGAVRPVFTVVQHAIAVGADDRVYVLGSSGDNGRPDHVYIFDEDGHLAGDATVSPVHALAADDKGRLTSVASEIALARSVDAARSAFEAFALPPLAGAGLIRLDDYAGKVVVLNFWASWCAPCRREMPQMNALARELSSRGVAIVGLNEDTNTEAGRRFLAELGITFPNAAGEGRLRGRFGYRGSRTPWYWTEKHRVVRALYGFGDSMEPVRRVVLDELARIESLRADPDTAARRRPAQPPNGG